MLLNRCSAWPLNFPLSSLSHCSQRKPQKPSLLFEDDDINGESFFSSQSMLLPSAAKAALVTPHSFKTNMEHLVILQSIIAVRY